MDIQRTTEIQEFNLTKVKGELINLNNFYPVLAAIPEIDEWQVEIRKKNNDQFDVDEMLVYLAPKKGESFNAVKARVQKAVHNEVLVNVSVIEKSLDEMLQMLGMETELKEKRIVDIRPKN